MKRLFACFIVAVIAVFAMIGARENYHPLKTSGSVPEAPYTQEIVPVEGIRMEVVEGSVTSLAATVAYVNETESTYTYGEGFSLQKLVDGRWYTMSWINDNVAFIAIGYLLEPGRVEKEYSWKLMHGEMEPGEYRIVTDVFPNEDAPGSDPILLAAPFTIE